MWPVLIVGAVVVGGVWLLSRYVNPTGALSSNPGVPGYLMVPRGLVTGNQLRLIHWIHWRGLIQGYTRLQQRILPWVRLRGLKVIPRRTLTVQVRDDYGAGTSGPNQFLSQGLAMLPEAFAPHVSANAPWEPYWPLPKGGPTSIAGGSGGMSSASSFTIKDMLRPNALHGEDLGLWIWPPSVWGDGQANAATAHVSAWLAHWEAVMYGRTHPCLTIRKQAMSGVDMAKTKVSEPSETAPYWISIPGSFFPKWPGGAQYSFSPMTVAAENVLNCYLWNCSYLASIGLISGPEGLPIGPQNEDINKLITQWLKDVKSSATIEIKDGAPSGQVKALAKGGGAVLGVAKGGAFGTAAALVSSIVKLFGSLSREGRVAWHDDWTPVWVHHSVFASAKTTYWVEPLVDYEVAHEMAQFSGAKWDVELGSSGVKDLAASIGGSPTPAEPDYTKPLATLGKLGT